MELAYRKKLAIHVGNVAGVALLNADEDGEECACVDLLTNCTEDVIQTLLDTPAVAARCYWERNRYHHSEIAKFLKDAILLLSQDKNSTGWTPLGDVFLKKGIAEYIAPRIEGIVIDTVSPSRLEGSGAGPWRDFPPETSDIQIEAKQLISSAIELLDKHCATASEFVRRELRVVVPRSTDSAGSSSTISYPGRAVLDFPKRGLTVGEVAEALVHESLHTLLYKLEAFHHWVDDGPAWSQKITSPWSGNKLSLHAYSHACFVWYALAGLWFQLDGVDETVLGVQPRFRMWGSVKGFLNDALHHIEQEEALSIAVRQGCRALQSDIVDWYG